MALSINGTTGISGVDGSASAPALQGTDSNTGINFASDTVNINTGGSTRATVASNGFLGVGTTSPTEELEVTANAPSLQLTSSASRKYGLQSTNDGNFSFYDGTAGAERMRIDSSGRLLLNTSSSFDNEYRMSTYITSTGGHVFRPDGTSTRKPLAFQNNSGSEVGSISSSTSSTSFNTSSDYRLKENAVAISDGITRLKTLKPYKFNWKIDEKNILVDGFFAHEVTAVPEAITGTKDEVDSDSNPVYQGIDQSKLVPLLTAALQEAVAKIEVLETKVAALEAG